MEFRALRQFVAVVDHGGIGKAALHLGLTQPSVSQTIKTLEAECGVVLFHRIGRGLVLSSAGEVLLRHARFVLRDLDICQQAMGAISELHQGTVSIAASAIESLYPLAPLLGAWNQRYPRLRAIMEPTMIPNESLELVMTGDTDLALFPWMLSGSELPDDLAWRPLVRAAMHIVLPPKSVINSATCTFDSLEAFPFIARPRGTNTRRILDEAIEQGARIKIAIDAPHDLAIPHLVAEGLGAAVLPEPLALEAHKLGAVMVRLEPLTQYEILLIHRDAPLTPAARALINVAKEMFPRPVRDVGIRRRQS